MKKRIFSILTALALFLTLLPTSAWAEGAGGTPFSGGSGTESDPYQITTADDLKALEEDVNSGTSYSGLYFKLMNDIDLGGSEDNPWTPIGYFDNTNKTGYPFEGTFDGAGYKISGLYIYSETRTDYQGLFGFITGTIQNVIVAGSIADALGYYIGAVVGVNDGGSLINCYSLVTISGASYVGGLVGYNNGGIVKDCYNGGTVTGFSFSGGIAGVCDSGAIEGCYNTSTVNGNSGICGTNNGGTVKDCYNSGNLVGVGNVGGIVGVNQSNGRVDNCHNTGDVSGSNSYVGGVVGYNSNSSSGGTVAACSNTGTVASTSTNVGGVAGNNANQGVVESSYNTGDVTGKSTKAAGVGGVVGYNFGTTTNCYNTGTVTDNGVNVGGVVGFNGYNKMVTNCYNIGAVTGQNAGGVIGSQMGTVSNCYYLTDTADKGVGSGDDTSTGAESKQKDDFTDINSLPGFDDSSIWKIDETLGLPVLTSNLQPPTYYTVSFDPNNGTDGINAVSGLSGRYALPLCTFTAPAGSQFIAWASTNGTQYAPGTTITVNENTTFSAVWKSLACQVTVIGGNGSGKYAQGVTVTITAAVPAGQRFVCWTSDQVTFTDAFATTTTFIMPDNDVTVTAIMASTAQSAPSAAPELAGCTTTSITLKEVTPNANGAAAQYGISKDGGETWTWQASPEFTGLSASTTYTFAVRYGEMDNYDASDASPTAEIATSALSSGSSSTPTYTPTVTKTENGSVEVIPKNPSQGDKVTITPKPDAGYEVDTVTVTDRNGETVKVKDNSDGTYSFTQPAGKVTVTVTFAEAQKPVEELPFTDVPTSAYYYDAVKWAVENSVTSGTSATTFSPDASCPRAQAVTFLWRAAGSPEPVNAGCPFTDVQPGAYYYDAVLWAVENGITVGTTATTFSPDDTVTRGQAVTFQHRAAGSPAASGDSFADVADSSYYASAVQWAVANGITNGTTAATFSPDAPCTRAQIVTFLYRAAA